LSRGELERPRLWGLFKLKCREKGRSMLAPEGRHTYETKKKWRIGGPQHESRKRRKLFRLKGWKIRPRWARRCATTEKGAGEHPRSGQKEKEEAEKSYVKSPLRMTGVRG